MRKCDCGSCHYYVFFLFQTGYDSDDADAIDDEGEELMDLLMMGGDNETENVSDNLILFLIFDYCM